VVGRHAGDRVNLKGRSTRGRTHTDVGNGERLADMFSDVFRYVSDADYWRRWTGIRWDVDHEGRVNEAAKAVAKYIGKDEADSTLDADEPEIPAPIKLPLTEMVAEQPNELLAWIGVDPATRGLWVVRRLNWEQGTELTVKLRSWSHASLGMQRINAAVNAFRTMPCITVRAADFDTPWSGLLNLNNGTLDTVTGQIRKHSHTDMLTKVVALNYDPHAKAPMWERFLEMNLPDAEVRRYLQKLAGYALTGQPSEKMLAYLYGKADTGKSIVVSVLRAMLGDDYAMAAPRGLLSPRKNGDEGRDVDRDELAGRRLVIASETKENEPMDEALVKALTGRDEQRTRGNYSRLGNRQWKPEFLIMIASNHYPRIVGDDDAIWGRIKVVSFDIAFPPGHPDRDETLEQRILRDELPGVLAWAVEGLRLYRAEGLVEPKAVEMATEAFRSDADGVVNFLMEARESGHLSMDEGDWCNRVDLYRAFRGTVVENGQVPVSNHRFYRKLASLGHEKAKRHGIDGVVGIGMPKGVWIVRSAFDA
jgi:putative DNA primase/helicase